MQLFHNYPPNHFLQIKSQLFQFAIKNEAIHEFKSYHTPHFSILQLSHLFAKLLGLNNPREHSPTQDFRSIVKLFKNNTFQQTLDEFILNLEEGKIKIKEIEWLEKELSLQMEFKADYPGESVYSKLFQFLELIRDY